MKQYKEIEIFKGATSSVEFDFTAFDFAGGQLILTIKEKIGGAKVFSQIFTEQGLTILTFEPSFTKTLKIGEYLYDLILSADGDHIPQCAPSLVIVKGVVGEYETI